MSQQDQPPPVSPWLIFLIAMAGVPAALLVVLRSAG